MSVSILILTKNEEVNLPACLDSVRWADDVHVFDAFSEDRTVQIAKRFGATVTKRRYDGSGSQRNAALDELDFKYPWVLVLDADERVNRGLAAELQLMQFHSGDEVAYRIRRRGVLGDHRLGHGGRPEGPVRFFRRDAVRYEGEVPDQAIVDGQVGRMEAPLDHHSFSTGFGTGWDVRSGMPRWLAAFAKRLLSQRAYLDGRAGITRACLQLVDKVLLEDASTQPQTRPVT